MKNQVFFVVFLFVHSFCVAQEAVFTLSVNKDTVLMNHLVKVSYTLKQADLNDFEPPEFAHFQVVSGPNVSSSFSMINGKRKQESSYTFYLRPESPGTWMIPGASVDTNQGVVATNTKSIVVLPNPDGILDDNTPNENRSFDDFFNRSPIPQEKPKTKRKTYRL